MKVDDVFVQNRRLWVRLAPVFELSKGPPIMAVLPSVDSTTARPWLACWVQTRAITPAAFPTPTSPHKAAPCW